MDKKKKSTARPPEPVTVRPEDVERGREFLTQLKTDISFTSAKKRLARELGISTGVANGIVVALNSEGFMSPSENWFRHPETPVLTGVVKGARTYEQMVVMSQTKPDLEVPIPAYRRGIVLPGDVFELREASGSWRVGELRRRGPTHFVCRRREGERMKGERVQLVSVNPFCPLVFSIAQSEVPADTNLRTDVIEVALKDEALNPETGGFPLSVSFVRRVGRKDDPLGEVAIASAEHGVPTEFSPETLAEADALPDEVDGRSLLHRVDLTDIPFVTIDGEDARDFDDAVYCTEVPEGWRLLVAIADVSHYVKPGSALDRDAQMRSTSVYFPASVVPMLPEKLSNGLCSLNPDVDRLVMVCDAIVDREGATTAYQFYPAVIHSHARLTYTNVWGALQGTPAGLEAVGERLEDLKRLYDLYKVLRAARERRSALDFETQESQALFDEKGVISGFAVREHNDAHRLIEECMLTANVAAADFVLRKKATTLFRVHPKPEPDRLRTLNTVLKTFNVKLEGTGAEAMAKLIRETKENAPVQTAILRAMSRAQYQPENIGHFGLQFPAYAHFTSPIRRYPDLLLHRTIKGILAKKPYTPALAFDDTALMSGYHARKLGSNPDAPKAPAKTKKEERGNAWARLGIITSAAERRADDASRDVMNYLKCDFMQKHRRRNYTATVTGMIPAGIFVTLEEMPIEGFVHISNLGWGYYEYDESEMTMTSYESMSQVKIGDRVRVRIETIDMRERRISFVLESNLTRHVIKGQGRSRRRRWDRYDFDDFDDFDDDIEDSDEDDDEEFWR